jgi:anti-sigma factor RsiW
MIRDLLVEYIEGELPQDQRRLVEKHMAHCWDCRHEAELLDLSWSALGSWKDAEPSVLFRARFWQKAESGAPAGSEEPQRARKSPWDIKWKIALPRIPRLSLPFPRLANRPPAWALSIAVVVIISVACILSAIRISHSPTQEPPVTPGASSTHIAGSPAVPPKSAAGPDGEPLSAVWFHWSTGSIEKLRKLPAYVSPEKTRPYLELNFKSDRLMDYTHDLLSEMM